MASESSAKSPSSSPLSNSAESFIGCFISLISKCDIRYEGVLYFLNIQDSTIGLNNVRSYGTEGRRKDGPQVPPSDKVYEYILFRGNDIKNLQIRPPSTSAKAEEQIFSDPAIIQSQYLGVPNSPANSVGGRSLTESIQRQDSPAMSSKAHPVGLPSHQSVTQLGPSNQSAATQVTNHPSFSTAMYWQGHSGTSNNSSHSLLQSSFPQPPSMLSPLAMLNRMQTAETQAPATKVGWTTLSECGLPVSSLASSLVNQTRSPSPTSLQISDSFDIPSLLPTKTSMPYSASLTFDGSNMPSYSSPLQDINSIEGQRSGQICPDSRSIHPRHSVHHPASSFVDYTSSPLPTPPSLLTPDQFAHTGEQFFSITQNLNPIQKDMGSLTQTSSGSPVLMPSPASQAPLLPLPTLVQKPQYSASQFAEEFDFEAMNEKFKKDEVWGSLGKAITKIEGAEHNASLNLGASECQGMIPNPKPAYKKDDFFDTISCNSVTRGSRNGQNRLSERMKMDTETFGNFQQRPGAYGNFQQRPGAYGNFQQRPGAFGNFQQRPGAYGNFQQKPGAYGGGYGAGPGENFRSSYNWGRGYGYGGRGRGRNFPF